MFIITMLFSVVYLILFPGLGSFKGILGWSETGQFDREVADGNAQIAPLYAKFAGMSIQQLSRDDEAKAVGDRLFMNNCAQCHGSDAKGGPSYPNLTSGHWNWGGTPDKIVETITEGRMGVMPPQAPVVGTAADISNVANYVLGLSGAPHDAAKATQGKEKFEAICAACHGPDGKGNQLLGSRDLTAKSWFLGPQNEEHITAMVNNGWMGQMPTWKDKFTPDQIRVLASYVWGKGGGVEPAAAAPAEPAAPAAPAPAADGAAS
jgi:cytochrome c oxidase cbb3-type subunit 3